jgi:hypothetical protein
MFFPGLEEACLTFEKQMIEVGNDALKQFLKIFAPCFCFSGCFGIHSAKTCAAFKLSSKIYPEIRFVISEKWALPE